MLYWVPKTLWLFALGLSGASYDPCVFHAGVIWCPLWRFEFIISFSDCLVFPSKFVWHLMYLPLEYLICQIFPLLRCKVSILEYIQNIFGFSGQIYLLQFRFLFASGGWNWLCVDVRGSWSSSLFSGWFRLFFILLFFGLWFPLRFLYCDLFLCFWSTRRTRSPVFGLALLMARFRPPAPLIKCLLLEVTTVWLCWNQSIGFTKSAFSTCCRSSSSESLSSSFPGELIFCSFLRGSADGLFPAPWTWSCARLIFACTMFDFRYLDPAKVFNVDPFSAVIYPFNDFLSACQLFLKSSLRRIVFLESV